MDTDIVIGPRWRVIDTYAEEKGIDLIIMGSHGIRAESGGGIRRHDEPQGHVLVPMPGSDSQARLNPESNNVNEIFTNLI